MGRGGSFREPDGEELSEDNRGTIFDKAKSVRYNMENFKSHPENQEVKHNAEKPAEDSKTSDFSKHLLINDQEYLYTISKFTKTTHNRSNIKI